MATCSSGPLALYRDHYQFRGIIVNLDAHFPHSQIPLLPSVSENLKPCMVAVRTEMSRIRCSAHSLILGGDAIERRYGIQWPH